ncbi:hypothetical protein [Maricaulis sp. CAU 1757]
MIDHTFDPLPKRTPEDRHEVQTGQGWFSSKTMDRAAHFADVSWTRVAAPAVLSLACVVAGFAMSGGLLPALLVIGGGLGSLFSLPAVALKATVSLYRA